MKHMLGTCERPHKAMSVYTVQQMDKGTSAGKKAPAGEAVKPVTRYSHRHENPIYAIIC